MKENKKDIKNVKAISGDSHLNLPSTTANAPNTSITTLWHWRLGHALVQRISKNKPSWIQGESSDVCLTP